LNPSTAAGQAVEGSADVTAIGADSFTLTMTDADPSQAFVGYIALGPAATPSASSLDPMGMTGFFGI
jgi:hypothetical protein